MRRWIFTANFIFASSSSASGSSISAKTFPELASIGMRRLARLITLLFLARINTVQSGIAVNVTRSPAFMPRLLRIAFGIVIWPRCESFD